MHLKRDGSRAHLSTRAHLEGHQFLRLLLLLLLGGDGGGGGGSSSVRLDDERVLLLALGRRAALSRALDGRALVL